MANVILNLVAIAAVIAVVFTLYKIRSNERVDLEVYDRWTMEKLFKLVKTSIVESVSADDNYVLDDETYEVMTRNADRAVNAIENSVYLIDSDVAITVAIIRDIIDPVLSDDRILDDLYDFDNAWNLEPQIKWELLLYRLSKVYGKKTIRELNKKYHFTKERIVEGEGSSPRSLFDSRMLDYIFEEEITKKAPLDKSEKIDIVAFLLFCKLNGPSVITSLAAQDIDGYHFGTSGSIRWKIEGKFDAKYRSTNSVWIQLDAQWCHLSFIDFGSEEEMLRAQTLLSSWGTTAPMSEHMPIKVNDDWKGSRITSIRKPAGECVATFVRNFSLGNNSVEFLLKSSGVKNWEIVYKLLYFLMQSGITTAFTGMQNTGKTTAMAAAIDFVKMVNIRVLEMSFETALREKYPYRDIFTVKPTDYVTSSQLQDILKKTDAYLSMVGEVAEDIVAARMIQFCLIASAFTLFSHHGLDDYALIKGLANSLVASGEYHDHDVAMSIVLDVINSNYHLDFYNRKRIVSYISQIVKIKDTEEYPELEPVHTVVDAIAQSTALNREYYTRVTDRKRMESIKIIEFNHKTMSYEPRDWYTPEMSQRIYNNLTDRDKLEFASFFQKYWGTRGYCL